MNKLNQVAGKGSSRKQNRVQATSSAFTPLPPLRGESEFPHYSVAQIAHMPCGAFTMRYHFHQKWAEWDRSDLAVMINLYAEGTYEALRHHPHFQREAAALGRFIESQRELSALLTALADEEIAGRGITPAWPVKPKPARATAPAEGPTVAA